LKLFYKLSLLALICPFLSKAQNQTDTTNKVHKPVFFVGAGINSSKIDYNGVGNDQFSNAKASNSISPQINIGTDIYFDKSQNFIFRMQLGFNPGNKANLTAAYHEGNDATTITSYSQTLKFTQNVASFEPQIIWNAYNGDKLKAFIGAGISINYAMYSNKESTLTTYFSTSGTQNTSSMTFPQMHSILFDVPVKVGVSIAHIFDVYAAYIPKTDLSQNNNYTVNLTQYQFGIDYFFGK
jgi:hypothetical protein